MNRLKFLVLFCLVFLLSGCKSDKKEVEYLTYDTRTKTEYYNNFFSDLSNIINTSNISIRMITNEGVNEKQGFFMQLDTITEKDNFKDIYFSLLMSDSYGVEIYHKNNKTIIGFKNKDSMEWYNSSMNIDSIINLENNTTDINNIFDGYCVYNIKWIETVKIDENYFDKVILTVLREDSDNIYSEYVCYVNINTNKIEKFNVIKVDNIEVNYTIYMDSIKSIKDLSNIDTNVIDDITVIDFDDKFLEMLLNATCTSLDISDISDFN